MRQSVAFGALNEQRAIMQLVSTHLSPNPATGSFDKQAICTGERAEDQQEQNEITNRLSHQYALLLLRQSCTTGGRLLAWGKAAVRRNRSR